MEVPRFMQEGSIGPAVVLLQAFLLGAGYGGGKVNTDGYYGEATADGVRGLQGFLQIEPDGNFGPATRAAVREKFDFDFEAACALVPGKTLFGQPKEPPITYSPEG